MSRRIKPYLTSEEYLSLERKAEYKSEYLNGEVFAMTGASRKHNVIASNTIISLGQQLKGKQCEIYPGEMRVKIPSIGLYTYPDITVVCGTPQFDDDYLDTLLNPSVVIEVLSRSTERYDRIAKASYYRTLGSLVEHLLIAQEEYRIEQYVKLADGSWALFQTDSLAGIVELQSIGCSLSLRDVYDRVSLD